MDFERFCQRIYLVLHGLDKFRVVSLEDLWAFRSFELAKPPAAVLYNFTAWLTVCTLNPKP